MNISKDEKKNVFSSVRHLLHEVKTPLATVQLALRNLDVHLQSVTNGTHDEVEVTEYIELMKKSLNQMDAKIRDLTIFSKADAFQFQPVSLENVVNAVAKKHNYNVKITKEDGKDLPLVSADESAITLALRLIINDSIRYAGAGDDLHIQLKKQSHDKDQHEDRLAIQIRYKQNAIDNSSTFNVKQKKDDHIGLITADQILRAHGSDLIIAKINEVEISMRFALRIFRD